MIPSIGRIVHYVFDNGEHRPAIIVRVWDEKPTEKSGVQLQVFIDGSNDRELVAPDTALTGSVWRTSVLQDPTGKEPRTWHEPEKV